MRPAYRGIALLLVVYAFSGIGQVRGGTETGNGGEALVCRDSWSGAIARIVPRDLHLARSRGVAVWRAGTPDEALLALSQVAPRLASSLRARLSAFSLEVIDVSRPLPPPTDADRSWEGEAIPGCAIETVILRHSLSPNRRAYFRNTDLWQTLSAEHRAALIVHELIADAHLSLGLDFDTYRTRLLVQALGAGDLRAVEALSAPIEARLVFTPEIP